MASTTEEGNVPEPQPQQPKVPERVYDLYSWSKNSPNARLVYIRNPDVATKELSQLRPGPLGFDLEWKPIYSKYQAENPVALVQLATEDTVLLIQLTAMRSTFASHCFVVEE